MTVMIKPDKYHGTMLFPNAIIKLVRTELRGNVSWQYYDNVSTRCLFLESFAYLKKDNKVILLVKKRELISGDEHMICKRINLSKSS